MTRVHSSEDALIPTAQEAPAAPQIVAPRLQMRWVREEGPSEFSFTTENDWLCHYELVLPLREFDIRPEVYVDGEQVDEVSELVIPIKGPTRRGSNGTDPCSWEGFDAPYRDGVHAGWDSDVLGDLPIFVIAPDGRAHPEPYEKWERRHTDKATQSASTSTCGISEGNEPINPSHAKTKEGT